MPTSLVKFLSNTDGNGRGKLFWGRADVDGAPYRGFNAPHYTDEEFEDKTVRVADPHNGIFHTWIPEENKAYLEVNDKILNGWAMRLYEDIWREKVKINGTIRQWPVHYIVWAEYYLEDGSKSPAHFNPLELQHGQASGFGGPFPGPQ
jgi:hypothetical protein